MIPKNQSVLLRYLIRCFCDISIGVFEPITNHCFHKFCSRQSIFYPVIRFQTYISITIENHPRDGKRFHSILAAPEEEFTFLILAELEESKCYLRPVFPGNHD